MVRFIFALVLFLFSGGLCHAADPVVAKVFFHYTAGVTLPEVHVHGNSEVHIFMPPTVSRTDVYMQPDAPLPAPAPVPPKKPAANALPAPATMPKVDDVEAAKRERLIRYLAAKRKAEKAAKSEAPVP